MIKLKKETMSLGEWFNIEDCPIQRDTERHAQQALKKHLKEPSPTHANVSAAKCSNGEIYKLDGHTRSFLWQSGQLEPPSDHLYVDMYYCDNMSQVEDLYQQFDNASAAENLRDKLYGAFRLNNFFPQSALIQNGGIASALSTILGIQFHRHSIYNAITPFIQSLRVIDSEDFSIKPFISPVLAAAIVTIHKDKDEALPFWRAYANDEGFKHGHKKDGVQALTELVLSIRTNGGAWPNNKKMQLAGKSLSAYLAYKRNFMYTKNIKTTDFAKYVQNQANLTRGSKAA